MFSHLQFYWIKGRLYFFYKRYSLRLSTIFCSTYNLTLVNISIVDMFRSNKQCNPKYIVLERERDKIMSDKIISCSLWSFYMWKYTMGEGGNTFSFPPPLEGIFWIFLRVKVHVREQNCPVSLPVFVEEKYFCLLIVLRE